MGWNHLSIPKLQRFNRWRLGTEKYFHLALCDGCNYVSLRWLKLNHISKRGPWSWGKNSYRPANIVPGLLLIGMPSMICVFVIHCARSCAEVRGNMHLQHRELAEQHSNIYSSLLLATCVWSSINTNVTFNFRITSLMKQPWRIWVNKSHESERKWYYQILAKVMG